MNACNVPHYRNMNCGDCSVIFRIQFRVGSGMFFVRELVSRVIHKHK